jgi:hypothetical protein
VVLFNELAEVIDMRARGIANHQTCRQVYDVSPVLEEFGGHVFHVSTRTTATTRKADELQLVFGGIAGKRSLPFPQSAEAFTASAIAIPGTDDDPYSYRLGLRLRPRNKLGHIFDCSG